MRNSNKPWCSLNEKLLIDVVNHHTYIEGFPFLKNVLIDQFWHINVSNEYNIDPESFKDFENDPLTYKATLLRERPLPEWLSFNSQTLRLSGTPPAGTENMIINIEAADPSGLKSTGSFRIIFILDEENSPPHVKNPIPDQTWIEGVNNNFTIPLNTFIDPEGRELAYKIVGDVGINIPPWLVYNENTRLLSGMFEAN